MVDSCLEIYDTLFQKPWSFLCSAPTVQSLPPALYPEISFIGRSNVGKSSLINATVGRKNLARISSTPGCTQNLNYFIPNNSLDPKNVPFALVDMPGYGYAKASRSEINRWTKLIVNYFKNRALLKRVYVLIDARRGIQKNDEEILLLLDQIALSYQIVLTKTDHIKNSDLLKLTQDTIIKLSKHSAAFPEIISTSSRKNIGISNLRHAIISAAT